MNMWTVVLLGFGTVFLSLVGLSLVLVLFRVLFVPKPAKATPQPVADPAPVAASDADLVAVIAAAIASFTATSVSSFRIAEVERVGLTTPPWGSKERTRRAPR